MKVLDLIRRARRQPEHPAPERPAPKVPRSPGAPNPDEPVVEVEAPPEAARPAVFVLSEPDGGLVPQLDWTFRRAVEIRLHHDTYRFLSALRRHLEAGGTVAAIVVDQIVPKFLFLTLLAHLDREASLAHVPVIYLRASSQVAVFVDGELRQTRPLRHAERDRVVAETVAHHVARRLEQLGIPVARREVAGRAGTVMAPAATAAN